MHIIDHPNCPNVSTERIDPSFIIIHYTACSLAKTLEIFFGPQGVAAHVVVDTDGTVHQVIPDCLSGTCYRGAHAGKSTYTLPDGSLIEGFNGTSIGIELVNLNGHHFEYPQAQLQSLITVCRQLFVHYPKLNNPEHILGHTDIAGFRGKVDPGSLFPWHEVLRELFPALQEHQLADLAHRRACALSPASKEFLERVLDRASATEKETDAFWMQVSFELEQLSALSKK